jgi:hypothetical protein
MIWVALLVFLFLLPGLVIFTLTTIALYSKKPYELLEQSTIPEEDKIKAKESFNETKRRCRKITFYDCTAPYVMLFVLPFVKWEAEELPKFFHKWNNEFSLNGDRTYWSEDGKRLRVPLEDTPEARALCYYAEGHHPRSFWARYVWLGWRNRASLASYEEGFEMTPELKSSHVYWGDIKVGERVNGVNGEITEGVLIRRCGEYYELYSIRVLNNKIERIRFGYKIGNAVSENSEFKRAMVVGIGLSYKRYKKE